MNATVSGAEHKEKAGLFSGPKGNARGNGTGKRWVLMAGLTVVLICAGAGIYNLFFREAERTAVTGKTGYGTLNEAIEGSGTTTPADSVSYDVNGTVLEWFVEAGDEVKAGDLLYVLDSSEAEDEILEHEVELDDLYDQLASLQKSLSNQNVRAPFSGRIEQVQAEVGRTIQNGAVLGTLVDDSAMKATLYFSYIYENVIHEGMEVTASFPEQMLTLNGSVTDIRYVDYVTTEGMHCFAVTIQVDNPGALTEGTTVTCWVEGADGAQAYSVDDAKLEYVNKETIAAQASGEMTAVNVVDYQRVSAGESMFVIDASDYEKQLETVQKQIENYEEKIADLRQSIDTEYTRYSDIDGQVVSASYATNRMTGTDMGTVTIYNQESMEISVNIDELDADFLEEGMEVTVYRTTSASAPVYYPATLTYLSLEATAGSSGVSTFDATITIDSRGKLASGVTVYYSIDAGDSEVTGDTVLAPLNALCSYDEGYYLLVQREKKPDNTIDPAQHGGTVTEYPEGYYAIPVEVGDYNASYIQILSGVEQDEIVFLRYQNTAPSGGDRTSQGDEDETSDREERPSFDNMNGMPNFGGGTMSGMPGMGGNMGQMGGMPGGRG